MGKDLQRLKDIYRKTDGCCHVCHRKLRFQDHGRRHAKGAWHIDHSVARYNGGTDHLNNLLPACIECNIEKGTLCSRTARSYFGNTRAPYSRDKKRRIRDNHIVIGALAGATLGRFAGPWGIAFGAFIGGILGKDISPRR